MTFRYIASVTAGLLLLIQMTLAFAVSGNRGKADTWVGDGGDATLLRTTRRHAYLAENAGLSQQCTNNPLRLIGGLGTYLLGFVLAGALVWAGPTGASGVQS